MKGRFVDAGVFTPVQPNQPDLVAGIDEHVHLIKQDAVGILFGEAFEGDEVHEGHCTGILGDGGKRDGKFGV